MWWTRSYKLVILKNGTQIPVVNVTPIKYDPICHVFNRNLTNSRNVNIILNNIKKMDNESKPIKLEAEDKCKLTVEKENTVVSGFFDEFESFIIPTTELLKLIEEWLQFLKYYEEGNIPNIIPKNMQEEFVIVPRTMVKEEYWKNKQS